jgi:hypothetical protein
LRAGVSWFFFLNREKKQGCETLNGKEQKGKNVLRENGAEDAAVHHDMGLKVEQSLRQDAAVLLQHGALDRLHLIIHA